jgi:HK97 family phage prohead protease
MLNRLEIPISRCNLKFGEAKDNGTFAGYASVFGGIDSFNDTITKGAFTDTIKAIENGTTRQPLMLFGHSSQNVVGKWTKFKEDDTGLWVEGEFTPNHTLANDVYASTRHGAIDGMSIGFDIPAGGSEELEEGGRRINKINLWEISIVGFPADDNARVAQVKNDIEHIESIRDAEHILRDAGYSRATAKALLSQLRPLFQREADMEREQKEAFKRDQEWLRKITNKEL